MTDIEPLIVLGDDSVTKLAILASTFLNGSLCYRSAQLEAFAQSKTEAEKLERIKDAIQPHDRDDTEYKLIFVFKAVDGRSMIRRQDVELLELVLNSLPHKVNYGIVVETDMLVTSDNIHATITNHPQVPYGTPNFYMNCVGDDKLNSHIFHMWLGQLPYNTY